MKSKLSINQIYFLSLKPPSSFDYVLFVANRLIFRKRGRFFEKLPCIFNSNLLGLFEIYFWIFWVQSTRLKSPFHHRLEYDDVRNLKGFGGFLHAFEILHLISWWNQCLKFYDHCMFSNLHPPSPLRFSFRVFSPRYGLKGEFGADCCYTYLINNICLVNCALSVFNR